MSVAVDVLCERVGYRPDEEVALVVVASDAVTVEAAVTHLGVEVGRLRADLPPGRERLVLGPFPEGSYAVRLAVENDVSSAVLGTAFDVLDDPWSRPRYGFVTDFGPSRTDVAELADSLRAFHLTLVQFYDWMYRHADLLPPQDHFTDALGRSLSLATVRDLVAIVREIGGAALGYAAVYGAGSDYADRHPDQVLRHRSGEPWTLAGFLSVMDVTPGSAWSRHVVSEMTRAVREVGFDGLHLDQYGHPQLALTASGETVHLSRALPALVDEVRDALPDSVLIFNNVNDFPTIESAGARQDATYIEVWPPHDGYGDLVALVDRARALAPHRPVILAAYLKAFSDGSGPEAVASATLALAVVWAAGGQYLLLGEVHGILTGPYYPRHGTLDADAVAVLRAFTDFAVATGDLLVDPTSHPTTGHLALGINEEVVVAGVPTSLHPVAGAVWVRTSAVGGRLVVQLVDLTGQTDARWNVAKSAGGECRDVTLTIRVVSPHPRAWCGHPLGGAWLSEVELHEDDDGDHVSLEVPPFTTWAVLVVDR